MICPQWETHVAMQTGSPVLPSASVIPFLVSHPVTPQVCLSTCQVPSPSSPPPTPPGSPLGPWLGPHPLPSPHLRSSDKKMCVVTDTWPLDAKGRHFKRA